MSLTFWLFILYFYNPISSMNDNVFARLPRNLRPLRYIITLTPYFDEKHSENKQFTFDGFVSIRFRVIKTTKRIVFNYRDLTIDEDTVYVNTLNKTKRMKIVKQKTDETDNFYTVLLKEPLRKGQRYVIGMNYVGNLTRELTGFYRSHYLTEDNEKRWIAVTQFSETYAREAFPCFDEPEFKAIFDIRINRLHNYTCLSNMPKKFTVANSTIDGRHMDVFQSTIRMSTYLVAFVVTDYKSVTNKFGNHTIWTQEKLIDKSRYILDFAADVLRVLEQFLESKYQLPKLDHVTIPEFFPAGMENWGLITYREKFLLYDPDEHTEEDLRFIFQTIAHEITHMWFGNQVTCKWWTYLWLNEGFATYFHNYLLSLVRPNWRMDEQFCTTILQKALFTDSAKEMPIYTDNSDLDESYPRQLIMYGKTGSIFRMIEHVLTMPVFRAGLINYLKEMKGKSVTDDDLWRSLQKAVKNHTGRRINLGGLDVSQIAKTWTTKSGFPLVYVARVNSTTVKIKQYVFEHYLEGNIDNLTESDWWIPINFATGENLNFYDTTAMYWLGRDPIYVECHESDWIILNKHQTAYYRIMYDSATWTNIIDLMLTNPEQLPPVNRGQLMDDRFVLLMNNYIKQEDFFNIIPYLINETDFIPWENMFSIYHVLYDLIEYSEKNKTIFQEHVRSVIGTAYDKIDIENTYLDDNVAKLNRRNILRIACGVQYDKCLQDVELLLKKLYNNEIKTISPDLQQTVFVNGFGRVSDDVREFLFERFKNSKSKTEKENLFKALTSWPSLDTFEKTFRYIADSDAHNLTADTQIQYLGDIFDKIELNSMKVCADIFLRTFDVFEKGLKSKSLNQTFVYNIKRLFEYFETDYPQLEEYLDKPELPIYEIRDYLKSLINNNVF